MVKKVLDIKIKLEFISKKPLTILYGDDFPDMQEYMNKYLPHVKYNLVKLKDPYGTHHS